MKIVSVKPYSLSLVWFLYSNWRHKLCNKDCQHVFWRLNMKLMCGPTHQRAEGERYGRYVDVYGLTVGLGIWKKENGKRRYYWLFILSTL
jgi:hypothetical protein